MALEASFLACSQFSWSDASCSWQLQRLPPCVMSWLGCWMLLASAGLTTALWPGPGWHDGKWLWTSQSDDFRRSSMKITNDMAVTKIGILVAAVVRLYFRGQFFWGVVFLSKFYGCSLSFSYFIPQTHARWPNLSNALLFAFSSSSQPYWFGWIFGLCPL